MELSPEVTTQAVQLANQIIRESKLGPGKYIVVIHGDATPEMTGISFDWWWRPHDPDMRELDSHMPAGPSD